MSPTFTALSVYATTLKFGLIVDDGNISNLPSCVEINPLQKSAAAPSESNSSQSQQSRSNNLAAVGLLECF
jgi:hypothetical protein